MQKPLGHLAKQVKYGPHRKTDLDGTARYLKGQHFGENGEPRFSDDSYVRLSPEELATHQLREGQIIVAAKGHRNFAWAYRDGFGPVVASSSFFVLTLRTDRVLPTYCALVLNTASCVRALQRMAKGTSVPVVPKRELLDLQIPLPPPERQAQLVALNDLQRRRQTIYRELAHHQHALDQAALTQLIYA